ncbi:MAG: FAD-dependent 5-carboxymethylaminomethyl-2-thiouridine(34) oxidoreductase MnmC, partial [Gammaproteobacteria bacterium]|nr:FAD-dependent 5-carboxymethylaminomethyl-2-thiouridine(34) oxidoreductase MnmC [Gammaproteobacteria bacterium]
SSNPAAIVYPRLSVNNEVDTRFYVAAYCYSLYILDLLQAGVSTEQCSKTFWFDEGLQQSFDRKRISDILQHFQFNKYFMEVTEQKGREENSLFDEKVLLDYKKAGVVLPQMLCERIVQVCGPALKIVRGQVDVITRNNNKWSCFSNSKLINKSDCLVIASGESINDLDVAFDFPVESIRGQAMVFNANAASVAIKKTINADVYFTLAIAGKHYLGATYSRSNKSADVDPEENKSLLASLEKIHPGDFSLTDLKESWVGFRCMSKDRVPVVGALPDRKFFNEQYADIRHGKHNKHYPAARYQSGLYITAAHGSRGFTSSFLSAEIIAAEIAGEPSPVNKKTLDYLSPSRFIINKLKRA